MPVDESHGHGFYVAAQHAMSENTLEETMELLTRRPVWWTGPLCQLMGQKLIYCIKQCERGKDCIPVVRMLINVVPNELLSQDDKMEAFNRAAYYSNLECVKLFLDAGFNAEDTTRQQGCVQGLTPLLAACKNGTVETIEMLLERKANVLATDLRGLDAIQHLITNVGRRRKGEMLHAMQQLIAHGATANTRTNDGLTPLYRVLKRLDHNAFDMDAVKLLLKNGATSYDDKFLWDSRVFAGTCLSLSARYHHVAMLILDYDQPLETLFEGSERFRWFAVTLIHMFKDHMYKPSVIDRMFAEGFFAKCELMHSLQGIQKGNLMEMSVARTQIVTQVLRCSWLTVSNCFFFEPEFANIAYNIRIQNNNIRIQKKIAICMVLNSRLGRYSTMRNLKCDTLMQICCYV